jgi:hypothetical protein
MIQLRHIRTNFMRRTETMLELADRARAAPDRKTRDVLIAHVSIELQTSLGYVSRSCFLAGMLGGKSAAGTPIRVKTGYTQLTALMAAAAVIKKSPKDVPGRDEPTWHSSDHLSRVVGGVKPANEVDILTSLGVFPEARMAVLAVRNFYAHRGQHTLQVIRNVLLSEYAEVLPGHPSTHLVTTPGAHANPFLDRWVWNYRDIVEAMCGS